MAFDVVWSGGVNGPYPSVVVCRAGGEMAYVRTDQYAGDVGVMCLEGGDGDEGGDIAVLDHAPDVDVALEPDRFSWCDSKFGEERASCLPSCCRHRAKCHRWPPSRWRRRRLPRG